ncbi:PAS domain S-box protein [bacterium SCSIO 12741]|nr:PAS domain S-box protein [bacterium SCSIO 12741]
MPDLFQIDGEQLNVLFPFYIQVDPDLNITRAGKSMVKLFPDIVGQNLFDPFNILRPSLHLNLSFESIQENTNKVFILKGKLGMNHIQFRGQVLASDERLLFVVSPWLTAVEDLEKHNLSLTDFAIHDPVTDMLLVIKVRQLAIQDYKKQQAILTKKNKEISELATILSESEDRYKQLVQDASDIIYKTNPAGFFTFTNSVAERQTKMTSEQLEKTHFTDLVREDWKENVIEFYRKQFEERLPTTYFEFPILDSEGNELWIGQNVRTLFEGDQIAGFHAVARDISEKHHFIHQIKESENKYLGIISNMNLGLLEVDQNEIIRFANQRLCEMSGYERNELIGKNARELFLPENKRQAAIKVNERRKAGKSDAYEAEIITKQKKKKWWLISGAPLRDREGVVEGSIGIHLDITEQKELEESLKESKRIAEESSAAKELFLANMSHEIRTPMHGIIGMSRLLQNAPLNTREKQYLEAIQNSSRTLLEIINDILDLSKVNSGKLELQNAPFSLSQLMAGALTGAEYLAAEKDLILSSNTDEMDENLVLVGDGILLHRILTNLLSNAIKFTPDGEVRLSCKMELKDTKTVLAHFEVKDTGMGIPKDRLESIFESFERVESKDRPAIPGTGLGLTICRQLVQIQQGKIWVESEEGKGSSFFVTIPYPLGKPEDLGHKEEKEDLVYDLSGLKILLAEDNRINQVLASSILEEYRVSVTLADNGKRALEILEQENFDLILMDIQMPEMNGIETTEVIRNQMELPIPILALTANAFKEDSENYLRAGMNDYLSKPFDADQLIEKVGSLTGRKRLQVKSGKERDLAASEPEEELLYNLEKIHEISRGNDDFVNRMINLFVQEIPKSLEALEKHLEQEDWASIKQVAHSINPSVQMMNITGIGDQIQELEKMAESPSDRDAIPARIEFITQACRAAIKQLEKRLAAYSE